MTLFFCLCMATFAGWVYLYSLTTGKASEKGFVVVEIPKGSSVVEIGHILGEAGLIEDDIRFQILAKYSGLSAKLQAGEFQLPSGSRPLHLLKTLSKAKPVQHKITVVEGMRGDEIGVLFAEGGWCDLREFQELVKDPGQLELFGLEGAGSLEGYLFPDTYYLTKATGGAAGLISMMVTRFQEVWAELNATYDLESYGMTTDEIITLASIVEKETGAPEERSRIASVFLNRLKRGMPLQSDPTVIYGIEGFNGNITKKNLRTPTPYNTYTLPALPVGPICSPGKAAIEAVLAPAEEKYLYFVSKNNGTHQFSTTLKEHNKAVWKYQRKKKKRPARK